MAKAILREPEAVQPWERAPLRSAPPRANASALTHLAGPPDPEASPEAAQAAAAQILEAARQQAERLLEEARREADQLRAHAARAGYEDGQTHAMEALSEERQRLRELLAGTGEAFRRFCLEQAPELAGLATEAAEKIVYEQLSLEPERVLTLVRHALEHVHSAGEIRLHLNPADAELVRMDRITLDANRRQMVQITPDPEIERGGCWIDSAQGEVDATLSGRISRLRTAATDEVMR